MPPNKLSCLFVTGELYIAGAEVREGPAEGFRACCLALVYVPAMLLGVQKELFTDFNTYNHLMS